MTRRLRFLNRFAAAGHRTQPQNSNSHLSEPSDVSETEARSMPQYCVNTNQQPNGDHEVHNLNANCSNLPDPANQRALGNHTNCHTAVLAAKQHYAQSNGCFYCANPCHTR